MDATFDFLDALGLDQDARERDIRSAYARRLKKIDQEHDLDGFQRLRAAYEQALDWSAGNKREAGMLPVATPPVRRGATAVQPEAPALPAPDNPHTLAQAAFQRLATELETLATQPATDNAQPWKDALRRRLDDNDLINIDARTVFETIVAGLLAQGWRPGHDSLFVAAMAIFGWDDDPLRVQSLGQAGPVLDKALAEHRLFAAQPPAVRKSMLLAARALRHPAAPEVQLRHQEMQLIDAMMARFPAMMHIIVSLDNVELWRAAYRAQFTGLPRPPRDTNDIIVPVPPQKTIAARLRTIARTMVLLFLAAMALLAVLDSIHPRPPAPAGWTGTPGVSRYILDTLVPPVHYQAPSGTESGRLETRMRVFLGADLRVEHARNILTSGAPGFDDAVAEALQAALPFPPGTPAEFEVGYSADVTAAPATGAYAAVPTVRDLAQPTMPEKALLRRHIPPVDYQPTGAETVGIRMLHYRVFLDADGNIVKTEKIKGSGEPRLDHAFEDALRAAKSFPASTARSFDVEWTTTITRKPRTGANNKERQPPEA